MILSASRRTDIPAFYFDWFLDKIEKGYVYVRNPMFPAKVSIVNLDPELIDAIVFWTKDAEPCLDKLDRLSNYMHYFQYTVNAYDDEIEKNVPKLEDRMAAFIKLSEKIGKDRVIWRIGRKQQS